MIDLINSFGGLRMFIVALIAITLFAYFLYRILSVIAVFAFLFLLLFAYVLFSTGALDFLKGLL